MAVAPCSGLSSSERRWPSKLTPGCRNWLHVLITEKMLGQTDGRVVLSGLDFWVWERCPLFVLDQRRAAARLDPQLEHLQAKEWSNGAHGSLNNVVLCSTPEYGVLVLLVLVAAEDRHQSFGCPCIYDLSLPDSAMARRRLL